MCVISPVLHALPEVARSVGAQDIHNTGHRCLVLTLVTVLELALTGLVRLATELLPSHATFVALKVGKRR